MRIQSSIPRITLIAATLLPMAAQLPAVAQNTSSPDIPSHIDRALEDWIAFYKTCHTNPELSLHESASAARIADRFEKAGLRVTRNVGGHGVVGLLENGNGPVILIRGDMDALPITEETGLPHASKVTHTREDGSKVGVMHACGHDVHMTVLIATAETMAALKDLWSGTIVFVAQPAEETGQGAGMMLKDGLYTRFPTPSHALALHVSHEMKAGTVGYTPGWALANVDSVNITIHGKGGHGAYPHQTVDPIVTAAQVVLALQTIVSRRTDPRDTAVITVGSIHAGSKHNVIADEATLQLTVRSYTDPVRRSLLDSIRSITTGVCQAAGCPNPPTIEILESEFTPAAFNDPELAEHCGRIFRRVLGESNVFIRPSSMGGEDFSRYSREGKNTKGFIYWIGAVEASRFEAAQKPGGPTLPSIHSALFQPDPAPTIRTGVHCMTSAALSLLQKEP